MREVSSHGKLANNDACAPSDIHRRRRRRREIDEVGDIGAVPCLCDRTLDQRCVHERDRRHVGEDECNHRNNGVGRRCALRPGSWFCARDAEQPVDDDHGDKRRDPVADQQHRILKTLGGSAASSHSTTANASTVTITADTGLRTRTPMVCSASDPLYSSSHPNRQLPAR